MTANASASPFDVLLFDVGGILVAHDNDRLFRRLLSRCRPGTTLDAVEALFADERWGTGTPIAALHETFQRQLGYGPGWPAFEADWCCHFALVEPMIDLVEALAARNRVALFSNTNADHWDHVVDLSGGRLGRFERYLSHEIGLAKPSPESFRHVAGALGVDPRRSIFFDDVADNVAGARRAGFQAEVFTDETAFRNWLAATGVPVGRSAS